LDAPTLVAPPADPVTAVGLVPVETLPPAAHPARSTEAAMAARWALKNEFFMGAFETKK
jgi:hypothetical protein